jgi:hypothetical protein
VRCETPSNFQIFQKHVCSIKIYCIFAADFVAKKRGGNTPKSRRMMLKNHSQFAACRSDVTRTGSRFLSAYGSVDQGLQIFFYPLRHAARVVRDGASFFVPITSAITLRTDSRKAANAETCRFLSCRKAANAKTCRFLSCRKAANAETCRFLSCCKAANAETCRFLSCCKAANAETCRFLSCRKAARAFPNRFFGYRKATGAFPNRFLVCRKAESAAPCFIFSSFNVCFFKSQKKLGYEKD